MKHKWNAVEVGNYYTEYECENCGVRHVQDIEDAGRMPEDECPNTVDTSDEATMQKATDNLMHHITELGMIRDNILKDWGEERTVLVERIRTLSIQLAEAHDEIAALRAELQLSSPCE